MHENREPSPGTLRRQIFEAPDDLKFRSSMTLFELVSGSQSEFTSALEKYFGVSETL